MNVTYRIARKLQGLQFLRISRFLLNIENFILEFRQKSRTDLAI